MAPSMMHVSRVGLGATSGSAATLEVDFLSCGIAKTGTHIQSEGIRGVRDYIGELVNDGTYTVGGPLVLHPRPTELDMILPFLLGAAESVDVFNLAATIPEFGVDIHRVGHTVRCAGMKANSGTFRNAPNQPLQLELDCQGKTETTGITFPSIAATVSNVAPYVFSELVLTLDSVAYTPFNIEISIQNNLELNRFLNSQSRTALPEQSRVITMNCQIPFTATEAAAFYALAVAGIDGSAVWTKGSYSTTFAFAKLQMPTRPVVIGQRNGEIVYQCQFVARHDATTPTDALIVTNVSA